MLQNRVDPSGNIIKTAARGSFMGNRGVLHNDQQQILRPFKLKAWITCALSFKGRKRPLMAPNRWTELFFLDEATSFAAGHRPCCECRRGQFNKFKSSWLQANPEYNFYAKTSIREIDNIIHRERIHADHSKVTYEEDPGNLPDGVFVVFDNQPYLLKRGEMFLWTPFGYGKGMKLPWPGKLTVLTPLSIVKTFKAGYTPQMAIDIESK